jgi:hypothetical protein
MVRQGQVRDAQKPWDKQRLSTGTVSKRQNSPSARSALGPRVTVLLGSPVVKNINYFSDSMVRKGSNLGPAD